MKVKKDSKKVVPPKLAVESDSSSDEDSIEEPEHPQNANDSVFKSLGDGEVESDSDAETPTKAKKVKKDKKTAAKTGQTVEEEKKLAYDKAEEPRTVFCGNIPNAPNVNETRIKDLFSEYGQVKSVRFRTEAGKVIFSKKIRKDCKSFIAYTVFEKEEDAKRSVQLNGYKLLENHLRVNMANNKKEAFSSKGTIFVGNLSFDATEAEIHEYFSQVGKIEYVRKIANKGIAYINFQKGVNLSKALKLNEKPFLGRNLRISRCESKDKQEKKKMFKKDEKTGRLVKQKVRKPHKINEQVVMKGRNNNNPIVKKIKNTQKVHRHAKRLEEGAFPARRKNGPERSRAGSRERQEEAEVFRFKGRRYR